MELDRTYSALVEIPQFVKELMDRNQLEAICRKALDAARLEEPIKTGNLRASTNFSISRDYIELYINPSFFFKTVPYYQYLDENHTRVEGYFERAEAKFREVLNDAFDGFYNLLENSSKKPNSALAALLLSAWILYKQRQDEKED